jgi:hypothetical protein
MDAHVAPLMPGREADRPGILPGERGRPTLSVAMLRGCHWPVSSANRRRSWRRRHRDPRNGRSNHISAHGAGSPCDAGNLSPPIGSPLRPAQALIAGTGTATPGLCRRSPRLRTRVQTRLKPPQKPFALTVRARHSYAQQCAGVLPTGREATRWKT